MKKFCLFALVLTVWLTACSAPAATQAPPDVAYAPAMELDGAEPGAVQPTPAGAFTAVSEAAVPDSAPGSPGQLSFAPVGRAMVIKDAQLTLSVESSDVAINQVTQLAVDSGGYIISAQTWYDSGYKYATLRLGVPSAEFERVLNELRALALQVVDETAAGQDVSSEYVDLQSRLTNLEATTARVRELLDEAKSVEDSLLISQQLSELETEIEQIKGQMRYFEGRSAFSTVTVQINPNIVIPTPTVTPTPTATPAWNPGETVEQATGTLTNLTQFSVDMLIWVVILFGPAAVVIFLGFLLVRSIVRRRPRTG